MDEEDKLNFLGETAEDNPGRVPTTENTPAAKTAEEIAAEAAAAETAKAEVTEKTEEKPVAGSEATVTDKDGKTVPLATFLGIIDENKDLKKQLKEGKKPAEEDVPQFEVPDPVKNPREYAAYQDVMLRFNTMNERMNVSERFAVKEHGKELIDKVREWALARMDLDEAFGNKVVNDADPYSVALEAYKEHIQLEEYKAWVAGGRKPEDAPGTKKVIEQPTPKKLETPIVVKPAAGGTLKPAEKAPLSIADASSAGGTLAIPIGAGQAFDGMFENR